MVFWEHCWVRAGINDSLTDLSSPTICPKAERNMEAKLKHVMCSRFHASQNRYLKDIFSHSNLFYAGVVASVAP